ncbi:MAG: polymorphic toxin type 33 domain-containing protein [Segniliparus sp.]|uniref:polymorphic toxin type 33 domain-containing protein n=1 Tax=Segniliparus sp. TaxID=2804064 RepID=UPI003F3ABE7A
MSLSRSQLESMNPSALHSLADQVGSVHNSLAEQVQSHEQISRNLNEGWRGTAADRAAGDVDDHLAKMRSNAEGVAQLRTALSNAGNELTSARSNVLNSVSQLESNGFRVGQDWSVQDASGKKGMQRSYLQRDGVSQLRDALTGLDQAQEGAGRAMQAALEGIKPVDSKDAMMFGPRSPAKDEPEVPAACAAQKKEYDAAIAEREQLTLAGPGEATKGPAAVAAHNEKVMKNAERGAVAKSALNLCIEKNSGGGRRPGRNPTQDKRLQPGEIKKLKKAGIDPEKLKGDKRTGQLDLFKDEEGNIYIKPKDGSGPGEPTGININNIGN